MIIHLWFPPRHIAEELPLSNIENILTDHDSSTSDELFFLAKGNSHPQLLNELVHNMNNHFVLVEKIGGP